MVFRTRLADNRRNLGQVISALVDVHQHRPLASRQGFLQRGYGLVRKTSVRPAQAETLQFLHRVVCHVAFAFRRAVDAPVVHQHETAVLRPLDVNLHHVHPHVCRPFDGRHGVLGRMPPVAPVGHDEHIIGAAVLQFRPQPADMPGSLHAQCQAPQPNRKKNLFHFPFMFNRSKSSPFRGKRRKRFTSKIDNLVFSGRKSEDTYQKMAEPHGQQPQNKAQYRVCGKRPELV